MKLLFVNGCISQRGEESRTLVLARTFLDAWQARHPEAEVETVEPEALLALKPFAPEMLNDRDALAGIRCFDAPVYDLARQFRAADRVVVAAPFWDLSFPGLLKNYIEYINVSDITFTYVKDQPVGLCYAKRLYYVTTAGGPIFADFGFSYLEALAKSFYGIPEVVNFAAQGLDLEGSDVDAILRDAKAEIHKTLCPGKI